MSKLFKVEGKLFHILLKERKKINILTVGKQYKRKKERKKKEKKKK